MLRKKVNDTIRKYGMLQPGNAVLVAVSGGPDSVCLLHVLHALAKESCISLHVAHLDHMFRGEESREDARFVAALADQLGIPATVEALDVPSYCRERGLSSQAGAREVRYRFLERVAGAVGARRIATGHTATDQAETLLMRLIRGAGLTGLSAIPPVRGRIIRPLIEVTREAVLEELREHRLAFRTDSSNVKPGYTRNRIRLEVLPALSRLNPRVVEAIATAASMLRDEDGALESYVAGAAHRLLKQEDDEVRLDRGAFLSLHPALRRRLLRASVNAATEGAGELSSDQTEEALRFLAEAQTGRAMHLLPDLVLEREYESIVLRPSGTPAAFSVPLALPGVTSLPDLGLEVETRVQDAAAIPPAPPSCQGKGAADWGYAEENYRWQAVFDYAKIALPLVVRSRRPGDRFHPSGMGGRSKKLQDFFVDEKLSRLRRDRVPILATAHDIVWVVGMRTDGRFLPGPGTEQVLEVRVRSAEEQPPGVGR